MKSRLVTRIVGLCLLALATGAAGAMAVVSPELRLAAAVAGVCLLALTTAFARQLAWSLAQSINQISETLSRLAKGTSTRRSPSWARSTSSGGCRVSSVSSSPRWPAY